MFCNREQFCQPAKVQMYGNKADAVESSLNWKKNIFPYENRPFSNVIYYLI